MSETNLRLRERERERERERSNAVDNEITYLLKILNKEVLIAPT